MKIEFNQIRPYLYHINFDTMYNMTSTMLRMAEYYESPQFKGKFFTLAQFKKWYISTKKRTKRFTYYEDWHGYNIPSNELKPFIDGKFKPLTKQEKMVVDLIKELKKPYYLIATFRRDRTFQETLDHEVTHGIYSFEKKYNAKVKKYLKNKDTEELKKLLVRKGYTEEEGIMTDEINAYLTNDLPWLRKKGLKGKQYDRYSKDLIKIRFSYWK